MAHRTITLASMLFVGLAACGGKAPPPAPAANTVGPDTAAAGAPAAGIHGCQFVHEGYTYGPHRCDVIAGEPLRLEKLSGMELLSATLQPTADGLVVNATGGCGDMSTACKLPITGTLVRDGDTWRGAVKADGDWWLNGATFELTDAAGYGGDTYGGAAGE